MKKRLPTFLSGMLTMALIGGLGVTALAATGQMTITVDPVNIQVNGQTFQPKDANGADVPVFAYNGTTYAPLRALAEAYGLTVGYDQEANMATVGEVDTTPTTVDENGLPEANITQDPWTLYIYLPGNDGFGADLSAANKVYPDGVIFSDGATHILCDALLYAASMDEGLSAKLEALFENRNGDKFTTAQVVNYSGKQYVSVYSIGDFLSDNADADYSQESMTYCFQFQG